MPTYLHESGKGMNNMLRTRIQQKYDRSILSLYHFEPLRKMNRQILRTSKLISYC